MFHFSIPVLPWQEHWGVSPSYPPFCATLSSSLQSLWKQHGFRVSSHTNAAGPAEQLCPQQKSPSALLNLLGAGQCSVWGRGLLVSLGFSQGEMLSSTSSLQVDGEFQKQTPSFPGAHCCRARLTPWEHTGRSLILTDDMDSTNQSTSPGDEQRS